MNVVSKVTPLPPLCQLELNPGETWRSIRAACPACYGLPASGSFHSDMGWHRSQFQPYTAKNALVLSSDTGVSTGTLTLATPGTFSRIAVIANSATPARPARER